MTDTNLIIEKIILSIIGTIAIILLSPLVIIVVIVYFIALLKSTKQCGMCGAWFSGSGGLCKTCEVVAAMRKYEAEKGAGSPWQTLADEASVGMDVLLAVDDYGHMYISGNHPDTSEEEIVWKILGRDM